jgi:2-oxoisovalerate dehydrogenase E2 component (dihydrolipoyl transacylase)
MSETKVFLLPDLGEGLTEAELVNWLVSVGDEIRVDQPIAEVETAKSVVEVPSPYAGTVTMLHGEPGQTLDVGKPLISVAPAGTLAVETMAAGAETYREEEKAGSGNVLIGYGTPGGSGAPRRTRARKQVEGSSEAAAGASEMRSPDEFGTEAQNAADDLLLLRTRVPGKLGAVISPLVRRMAREHGVDLGEIHGSGDSGLIMRRDVEEAITKPAEDEPRTQSAAVSEAPVDARTGLAIVSRTPIRGVRKAVAANMVRSHSEIPDATVWVDVDATALVELRADLKKGGAHAPGLLAFIARFVTAGLKKYPELNTRIETAPDGSQQIVAFEGINLGFAAQTDRGLMVPSIRAAEKLTARELDAEIRRLSDVVRGGKGTQ